MKTNYEILYDEEKSKTFKHIDIVSTLNQSIATLSAIVTFFFGICFYFSKTLFPHYNFNSFLFLASSFLWIFSCIINIGLFCELILNLFNNEYYLPILDNNYVKKMVKFIQGSADEKADKIYENLFKGYVEINQKIDNARKKRIKFFNTIKKIFIFSLILFCLSVILFGMDMATSKAYVAQKEKDDRIVVKEGNVYYNSTVICISESEKAIKKGGHKMCDDEKTAKSSDQNDDNNPPDIRSQIKKITAAKEVKGKVKKIIIENEEAEEKK